jgi:hypothetical protein
VTCGGRSMNQFRPGGILLRHRAPGVPRKAALRAELSRIRRKGP